MKSERNGGMTFKGHLAARGYKPVGLCLKQQGTRVMKIERNGGMTFTEYLAARGYKPMCCDNTSEDLWIISCCYTRIYAFLVACFCLLEKAVLLTNESHAAVYKYATCFVFIVTM
jgi:hypothetical protein